MEIPPPHTVMQVFLDDIPYPQLIWRDEPFSVWNQDVQRWKNTLTPMLVQDGILDHKSGLNAIQVASLYNMESELKFLLEKYSSSPDRDILFPWKVCLGMQKVVGDGFRLYFETRPQISLTPLSMTSSAKCIDHLISHGWGRESYILQALALKKNSIIQLNKIYEMFPDLHQSVYKELMSNLQESIVALTNHLNCRQIRNISVG